MEPYSNRELDSHFAEIKAALCRIEVQTIKTNGRVSSLELWRYLQVGALTVITGSVVPLLVYIWQTK